MNALISLALIGLVGCAPPGYIDGESACEIEVKRLKEELDRKPAPVEDYDDSAAYE
jgi:hypothetical protein